MTEVNKKSRYLEYLPAIYHKEPFLGQFLLAFEEELTGFEELLSDIDCYFNPALTPDGTDRDQGFLNWLAGWVALALDENWAEVKQRRLIREAVKLYRDRGMVAGLKRYLEIYDDRLTPDVREGRWPGGMQIGVASQLGGLIPDDVSLTRIEKMDWRTPAIYYDYYVVDTVAPANHPHVPAGQSLRLYYRADRVTRVLIGGEPGAEYVSLRLSDGRSLRYQPATVIRRDGLINERYTLRLESETESKDAFYRGDTFLIDEVDLTYRFTVDIQVPCADWEFLFSCQFDPQADSVPEILRQEFEFHNNILLSDDVAFTVEEKGRRWWKIDGKDQRYIAVRKGIMLDVYAWAGCKDWEDVQTIRAIIDEVKPAHTMYYLKLTPVVKEPKFQPMQIGVRATIDVDTIIG